MNRVHVCLVWLLTLIQVVVSSGGMLVVKLDSEDLNFRTMSPYDASLDAWYFHVILQVVVSSGGIAWYIYVILQVVVSSGGMLVVKLDSEDLNFRTMSPYDASLAYGQTKRQQAVMVEQLTRQYPGVHFSVMHPGWVDTPGTFI